MLRLYNQPPPGDDTSAQGEIAPCGNHTSRRRRNLTLRARNKHRGRCTVCCDKMRADRRGAILYVSATRDGDMRQEVRRLICAFCYGVGSHRPNLRKPSAKFRRRFFFRLAMLGRCTPSGSPVGDSSETTTGARILSRATFLKAVRGPGHCYQHADETVTPLHHRWFVTQCFTTSSTQ